MRNNRREPKLFKKSRKGFPRDAAHMLPAVEEDLAARIHGGRKFEILVVWSRDNQAAVGRKQQIDQAKRVGEIIFVDMLDYFEHEDNIERASLIV